jgi:hypothetical protein
MLQRNFFSFQSLDSYMPSLVIRAATIRDLPSIVKIRTRTLSDEEISVYVGGKVEMMGNGKLV